MDPTYRWRRGIRLAMNKQKLLSPPSAPALDDATRDFYESRISKTKTYVEFGTGGTTLIAARNVDLAIGVDSDSVYKELVEKEVSKNPTKGVVELYHGDVGLTSSWGKPMLRVKHLALKSGQTYIDTPFKALERHRQSADFVLIDGRYRVASALATLLHPLTSDGTLLVDDFHEKRGYHAILEHVEVLERPGRSLVARRKQGFDAAKCRRAFNRHLHDCR